MNEPDDKPPAPTPPYPPNYRSGFGVPDLLEIDDEGNVRPLSPGPEGIPRKAEPAQEYKPDRPVKEPRTE